MLKFTLQRIYRTDCTLGILFDEQGFPWLTTLELPWKSNQKGVSCIPEGTYKCEPYKSPAKGDVFLLKETSPRSMIEIHIGNTVKDILGCILVGLTHGKLDGLSAVLNSTKALELLKKKTNYQTFELTITK